MFYIQRKVITVCKTALIKVCFVRLKYSFFNINLVQLYKITDKKQFSEHLLLFFFLIGVDMSNRNSQEIQLNKVNDFQ